MEHPVREIASIITALTTGSPQQQKSTLTNYFLSDASFTHPFCHVPSFTKGFIPFARNTESRWVILQIYRWYRTLSPNIDITVDSAVFDQRTNLLFVNIHQTFRIWFIPFYAARVRLATVLRLKQQTTWSAAETAPRISGVDGHALAGLGRERSKYYIASQEDLYQLNDCVQFLLPRIGGLLWMFWQLVSTVFCIFGAVIGLPVYYLLNSNKTAKRIHE